MKTSYTLFGILWDNIDVSKTKIRYISCEDIADIEDYTIGFNLFDNPEYNRKISMQKLLSFHQRWGLANSDAIPIAKLQQSVYNCWLHTTYKQQDCKKFFNLIRQKSSTS